MTNVPMTRPEETLAVHEANEAAPSTFVELADGCILGASIRDGTSTFATSDDGFVISMSYPV